MTNDSTENSVRDIGSTMHCASSSANTSLVTRRLTHRCDAIPVSRVCGECICRRFTNRSVPHSSARRQSHYTRKGDSKRKKQKPKKKSSSSDGCKPRGVKHNGLGCEQPSKRVGQRVGVVDVERDRHAQQPRRTARVRFCVDRGSERQRSTHK